jgi:hypothetical protein
VKTGARVTKTISNASVREPREVQLSTWNDLAKIDRRRGLISTCAVHDLVELPREVKRTAGRDIAMSASPEVWRATELAVTIEVIVGGKAGSDDCLLVGRTEAKLKDEARLQRGGLDTEEDTKVVTRAKTMVAAVDDACDLGVDGLQAVEVVGATEGRARLWETLLKRPLHATRASRDTGLNEAGHDDEV